MRVAVTGATGLLGRSLLAALQSEGHEVVSIVRRTTTPGQIAWDPDRGPLSPGALDGCNAVVHLAGESIARGRWSGARKERLRSSRIGSTRLLAEALAAAAARPAVLLCASATGYYGDRGDEELSEDAPAANDFLGVLCRDWEEAAAPAARAGVRVAHMRLGVVLAPFGGVLGAILPLFRLGLGGRLGPGTQYMSWVALEDFVGAVMHLLARGELSGPVNVTSPGPVTNAEWTQTLARVLGRPALFPVPAFALRIALGDMAQGLLLSSARVLPRRLLATGYAFRLGGLEAALRRALSLRSAVRAAGGPTKPYK